MDAIEQRQKELFDQKAGLFEAHYSDKYTEQYRRDFVYNPMTEGIDLKGKKVLEALCGSGQATPFFLEKGAQITGLDISEKLIESFRNKFPQCEAICSSVFDNNIPDSSYDVVSIIAGLHHLHPRVDECVEEVYRILKPGGYFIFMEPQSGSLPDIFRKIWYRIDRSYFEENEGSVDIDHLKKRFSGRFKFNRIRHTGFLAFLLVYNSYVFRMPLGWKKYYSPFLLKLDKMVEPLQGKLGSCIAVCQWQKTEQ
jgi:ubiquinone/menaquinone biosynthesis C-methylase UbiE